MRSARYWSRRGAAPYLFVAPFFVIYAAFFATPVFSSLYLSLTKWSGVGTPALVGLANYERLLFRPGFVQVLVQTAWYVVGSVGTIIPFAFALALLLNSRWLRFRNGYRLLFFLPAVTSAIVIGISFASLYHVRYGLFAWSLGLVGLEPIPWLDSETWFKPAVLLMIVWRWVGYNAVYFLAGLQNIPPELYEAASIDGATWRQRLVHVTLPLMRPVLLFVLIVEMISDLQLFEDVYILDPGGGPAEGGLTAVMYLYRYGLLYGELGYAAAVGVFIALLSFLLSVTQFRLFGASRDW